VRVLVVEDEKRLAENVARALREGAGYAVDIAGDGAQGLFLAASDDYDLVVLDLMLPKLSGPELLLRYRKQGHATPVLVLTARDEKESVVRLLNAGADDYVTKPFDPGACSRCSAPKPGSRWRGLAASKALRSSARAYRTAMMVRPAVSRS